MIWSYLLSHADQLMLALTCKSHMAIFQELRDDTHKSVRTKKPAKEAASSSSTSKLLPVKRAPTKLERLHILIRLESWMPKHFRLCYECVRYVTRSRVRRKITPAFSVTDGWSAQTVEPLRKIKEKDIAKELRNLSKFGQKCAECVDRARLDVVAAKAQHKELKRELAKLI